MHYREDTSEGIGGGVVPDALTPDDLPQGEATGTEGQSEGPQGGTD